MQVRNGIIEAIGNTPLLKLERVSAADRLHDPRQGRIHESRPIGQGPGRAVHHRGRGEERRIAPGRRCRRRHRRQYRHRACAGRQCHGLPLGDRDPGDAEPGKEGHVAALRRRTDRSAGRALFEPEQLREAVRPARRSTRQDRKERRDLGQSVRQCRQSSGAYRRHRTGNLGSDRRQSRRLRLRGRLRRHARRRRAWR